MVWLRTSSYRKKARDSLVAAYTPCAPLSLVSRTIEQDERVMSRTSEKKNVFNSTAAVDYVHFSSPALRGQRPDDTEQAQHLLPASRPPPSDHCVGALQRDKNGTNLDQASWDRRGSCLGSRRADNR